MTPTVTVNLEEMLTQAQLLCGDSQVLYGVSWHDYQQLLDLTEGRTYPKLTYYNGVLKIMGKQGTLHENISRFLQLLVMNTALILRQKAIPVGAMSLVSKRLSKGADPDESFYIQNADQVKFKKTLFDDEKDVPPDLVIEVDESSKSSEKFAIYAAFGIKEFWRYDQNQLKIYELDEFSNYREISQSIAFPILSTELLNEFLTRREQADQFDALLDFESRLREQIENK